MAIYPLQTPPTYYQDLPSPMDYFQKGQMLREQIEAKKAQREKERAELAKMEAEAKSQEENQARIRSFWNKPSPTMRDAAELASYLPKDRMDAMKPYLEGMEKEKQQSMLKFATQVMSALQSNNPDIGAQLLEERAVAERNAGDEASAKEYERYAESIRKDGPGPAFKTIASIASYLPGAKENFETAAKIQQMPFETDIKAAEARIKQRQAEGIPAPDFVNTAQGIMQWDPRQGKLVPTGYQPWAAPPVQVSIGEGQKGFENETTLRKEYNTEAKPFNEVSQSYSRLTASAKDTSGASDIAMIYSYMKMLDPGSVVREGEFATAENAGGVGARIRNLYNKVLEGNRLTPEVRKEYMSVARRLYTESQIKHNSLKKRYKGIAERAGLNPQNIIVAEEVEEAPQVGKVVEVNY